MQYDYEITRVFLTCSFVLFSVSAIETWSVDVCIISSFVEGIAAVVVLMISAVVVLMISAVVVLMISAVVVLMISAVVVVVTCNVALME